MSIIIASSPKGTKLNSPDGYADFCVDVSGLASDMECYECAAAANSAAGMACAAAIVADLLNGYCSQLPSSYFANIERAVKAACEIDGLAEQIESEFHNLLQQVELDGLTDYSPIDRQQIESGFKLSYDLI